MLLIVAQAGPVVELELRWTPPAGCLEPAVIATSMAALSLGWSRGGVCWCIEPVVIATRPKWRAGGDKKMEKIRVWGFVSRKSFACKSIVYRYISFELQKFRTIFRIFLEILADLGDTLSVNDISRQSEKIQVMARVCPSVRTATFYLDRSFTALATFS